MRSTKRFASDAVIAICQIGNPKRALSSPATQAASADGSIVVMPSSAWRCNASAIAGERVTGHRSGVAETEVDVLVPIDVDETCSRGTLDEHGVGSRPARHPRHGYPAEQVRPRFLRQLSRARMCLDEPFLLHVQEAPDGGRIDHRRRLQPGSRERSGRRWPSRRPVCRRLQTGSRRAATDLCHGVPAHGSRSSLAVSSFGATPVTTRPSSSG